jgi:ABC-2 type transport system ATP-binding protein
MGVSRSANGHTSAMSTGDAVIEIDGLTKRFGHVVAVSELDLTVRAGEVVGFVGPNGAGKSTTARLLLGLLAPTNGRARVLGVDARTDSSVLRRVGYLPGDFRVDPKLTGNAVFELFGGMRGGVDPARTRELVERLDLDPTRTFRELSKGNRQKIGIVQALQHEPDVLVLDEPTSGLDPLVQRTFQQLVREATDRGAGVLLSSHVLPEIEHIASRLAIIRRGELVATAPLQELLEQARRSISLQFAEPPPEDLFDDVAGVATAQVDGVHVVLAIDGSMDAVLRRALADGRTLVRVGSEGDALEDLFVSLYRDRDAATGGD